MKDGLNATRKRKKMKIPIEEVALENIETVKMIYLKTLTREKVMIHKPFNFSVLPNSTVQYSARLQ
jgi:hypothetical protein